MSMEDERTGHPKNALWDCVSGDVESFGVSCEHAQDKRGPRINGESANDALTGKWPLKRCVTDLCRSDMWIGQPVCRSDV